MCSRCFQMKPLKGPHQCTLRKPNITQTAQRMAYLRIFKPSLVDCKICFKNENLKKCDIHQDMETTDRNPLAASLLIDQDDDGSQENRITNYFFYHQNCCEARLKNINVKDPFYLYAK